MCSSGSLGITRTGQMVLSQVDGNSDMMSLPALCGRGSAKEQWPLLALPCRRKSTLQHCPDARQFNSSLYVPGVFQGAAAVLELRESESSKSMRGPFKRNTWDSRSPPSHSATSWLVFTARNFGDFSSSWNWNPVLRFLM